MVKWWDRFQELPVWVSVLAILVVFLVAVRMISGAVDEGRGGSTESPNSPSTTAAAVMDSPEQVAQNAESFRRAEAVSYGKTQMARELGASSGSDTGIATAFADGYQPRVQAAAFQGCLRGLVAVP